MVGKKKLRHFAGASVQIGGSKVLTLDDVDDLIGVWTDNDVPAIDKNNLIAAPLRIDFNDAGRDRIELDRGRNARPDRDVEVYVCNFFYLLLLDRRRDLTALFRRRRCCGSRRRGPSGAGFVIATRLRRGLIISCSGLVLSLFRGWF